MTFPLFLLMISAGGVGACVRFVLDETIRSRNPEPPFPISTALINLSGCFVLGFLTGLVVSRLASEDVRAVVGSGFVGGYTTFSMASFETVQLIREMRYGAAAAYAFGILAGGVALALIGFVWGKSL